ncbi:hypothetical protein [Aquimarina sp. MMG016]|uniref:hypothetical protein n=1 Tax=Aquimarina sp. MMG016 TaxID=2822690 RepID=UPI001B3A222E|nr:hypothetical protein [Aquimarina sp. MMG016]MBQ4822902.1 hypothetical protein [Aquimarina sp. MMG016]
MNILPKYGLLQYRNAVRIYTKDILESLSLFKKETKEHKTTLLIIHEHGQLEELDSVINFLKSFGVLIYADWIDEDIARDKSDTTIQYLKNKVSSNEKIIFLATEEAIQSKWCNWVLRFIATQNRDVVILPIREDFSDYGGIDLLNKYPYINEISENKYQIRYPKDNTEELENWLESVTAIA